MSRLYEGGILRWGPALSAPSNDHVQGPFRWDGKVLSGWVGANAHQMIGLRPDTDHTVGRWLVILNNAPGPFSAGAKIVDSTMFDSVQDASSLEMWAMPSESVSVQSLPVRLDAASRDTSTGAWASPLKVDAPAAGTNAQGGTAQCSLWYFDRTGYTVTGSPDIIWSEIPPSAWTPRTSWPTFTPPEAACYVAIRYTFTASGSASGVSTIHLREPALVFDGSHIKNIGSNDFAARYPTY